MHPTFGIENGPFIAKSASRVAHVVHRNHEMASKTLAAVRAESAALVSSNVRQTRPVNRVGFRLLPDATRDPKAPFLR